MWRYAFPQYSRFFSDYGLGSSGGFRHILYVLSGGGTMFFPGASPMETLQTFALYRVQGLIASPGGLSGFLTFYDTNRDFPCGFDIILSAGSPLPDSLSQRVRARMCSNLIFYYGTTETSTVASASAHALIGASGAVGYVTPDVSVQIVDDSGNPVPANQEGAVRVRTPVSVHGYLDDPAPAQTAFRDGYFDTGDTGFLTDENMLVIVPNEMGIDEVWALVTPNGKLNEDALQQHCREKLAPTHVPGSLRQRRGDPAQRAWEDRPRTFAEHGAGVPRAGG